MVENLVKLMYELSEHFAQEEKALYDVMEASQVVSSYSGRRGQSITAFLEGQRNN